MKQYKLLFSQQSLSDMKEARTWYNLQQKGLGKRMITDVKSVITAIRQNPYFASVKFENIRTATFKRFPYAVHFEIDEGSNIIRIVSIFHFSRKPYWLDK